MTLFAMLVSPYEKGYIFNREPRRPRRLLMHKREILRPFAKIKQDGYTLVTLSLNLKGPRVKVEDGSACARAKSSTTSGRPQPRRTPSGRWTGP